MLIRHLFRASTALLLPVSISAQAPAASGAAAPHDQAATLQAARRSGVVRIDGKLDDAAWQAAPAFGDFRQIDPAEGQPASERTEARILIDDVALYVGVRAFDREPGKIQKQLTRRDEPIEADIVEVTLDSYHDHLSAFHFRLSPLGARRDATITANGQDGSWDSVWEGSASVDSTGWYAEFRIPLSQLRYDPGNPDHVWGLQIGRSTSMRCAPS